MDTLKIFISSPGDVAQERALSQRIIQTLQGRFQGVVKLQPIFWEHEPLLASSSFQDQITLPSQTDIVVCILWSRLGTRLPPNITRPDGSLYASGTEFEFENAMRGFEANGTPALLVYQNTAKTVINLDDEQVLLDKMQQKKALDKFINQWFFNADGSIKSAFHQYQTLDSFENKIEQHLQVLIENQINQRGLVGDGAESFSAKQQIAPYRGLAAFEADHQQLFFGRTREIHQIIEALLAQANEGRAFTLVFGASGSGKSSLIRAGVMPMLTRPGVAKNVVAWRQAVVKPTDSELGVTDALVKGLLAQGALPELSEFYPQQQQLSDAIEQGPDVLNTLILRLLAEIATDTVTASGQRPDPQNPPQAKLVLLIDQFEELFTSEQVNHTQRQQFFTAINTFARGGGIWILSTLRSDFYGHCAQYDELVELKEGRGQYDLQPPRAAQIGQMIRQPALLGGLVFEKDQTSGTALDDVLLDSASNNPASLPLLSFTLDALYNNRTKNGKLTFAAYQALGGLEGALAQRAEAVFNQQTDDVQQALPQLIGQLLKVDSKLKDSVTRRRCIFQAEQWSQAHKTLVEAFISARLFVSTTNPQGHRVITLAHEALIGHWPRMAQWVEDNWAALQIQQRIRRATKDWLAAQKDPSIAFTGNRLTEVSQWFEHYNERLDQHEREFVQLCIKLQQQKVQAEQLRQQQELALAQQTARKIGFRNKLLSGVGMFSTVLALVAGWQYLQSEAQREKAVVARDQADDLVGFMIDDLSLKLEEVGRLDILGSANQKAADYIAAQDNQTLSAAAQLRQLGLLHQIGYVHQTQGQSKAAYSTYHKMHDIAQGLVKAYPDIYKAHQWLGIAHHNIGLYLKNNEQPEEALVWLRKEQTIILATTLKWPNEPEAFSQLNKSYTILGNVFHKLKRFDEGIKQLEKAIALGKRLTAQNPNVIYYQDQLFNNYSWLANLLYRKNQYEMAINVHNQSIKIILDSLSKIPGNARYKYELALQLTLQARSQIELKHYDAARKNLETALADLTKLVSTEQKNLQWISTKLYVRETLGQIAIETLNDPLAQQIYHQQLLEIAALKKINPKNQSLATKHQKAMQMLAIIENRSNPKMK